MDNNEYVYCPLEGSVLDISHEEVVADFRGGSRILGSGSNFERKTYASKCAIVPLGLEI